MLFNRKFNCVNCNPCRFVSKAKKTQFNDFREKTRIVLVMVCLPSLGCENISNVGDKA